MIVQDLPPEHVCKILKDYGVMSNRKFCNDKHVHLDALKYSALFLKLSVFFNNYFVPVATSLPLTKLDYIKDRLPLSTSFLPADVLRCWSRTSEQYILFVRVIAIGVSLVHLPLPTLTSGVPLNNTRVKKLAISSDFFRPIIPKGRPSGSTSDNEWATRGSVAVGFSSQTTDTSSDTENSGTRWSWAFVSSI
ncbi:uncharacterized protein F5891DRAFT_1193522 [Suillus fuscotomentosus]|uniref:PRO8NT domain-containing protein n=1 Tax=Suillus fuscotomentosus TaxID=1912939 RepID=A0AAD4DXT0_9AGAM|nr:uncharacterized protein F5891DRAFT_1193522 [Suillus fuscotomentosus]KAG1896079.1 hypothetical protein F5891DRAFT_1193522 [Suillus fuscotomentosus]